MDIRKRNGGNQEGRVLNTLPVLPGVVAGRNGAGWQVPVL